MSVKLPPLLVVDDEKNMRLSLEAVMAEEGYEIRAVDSAEAALRLLEQEEFFMIITDARLNGMSGYEFLGQWHERLRISRSVETALAERARVDDHGVRHAQARCRGHQGGGD